MARQIIWTISAQTERREILEYWVKRNKSKIFSKKLNKLIITNLREIGKNPLIGRKTDIADVRVKIIRDYLIFYEITPKSIFVLSIWDGRRDNSSRALK